jgi:hypothetical protein
MTTLVALPPTASCFGAIGRRYCKGNQEGIATGLVMLIPGAKKKAQVLVLGGWFAFWSEDETAYVGFASVFPYIKRGVGYVKPYLLEEWREGEALPVAAFIRYAEAQSIAQAFVDRSNTIRSESEGEGKEFLVLCGELRYEGISGFFDHETHVPSTPLH